jgi:hypothetical protein
MFPGRPEVSMQTVIRIDKSRAKLETHHGCFSLKSKCSQTGFWSVKVFPLIEALPDVQTFDLLYF